MRLLVISFAPFIKKDGGFYAYSPYIKEMEIWAKYSNEIAFACPVLYQDNGLLISEVRFPVSRIFVTKAFDVTTIRNSIKALLFSFWNFFQLFRAMIWADHIHLRCPGNLGLMACIVQIFFPWKVKTAKYAGNWDPQSKQPFAYNCQKWLLNHTVFTRNMQVLVYGEWAGATRNIKSFFTASYHETDKVPVKPRSLNQPLDFIFVGTLSVEKRPMYAIQLVESLLKRGINARLSLYGHGVEKFNLERYIADHQLEKVVFLKGNFSSEAMKTVYQEAHFNILPSKSEGWPKVVAEAMFWGCLPVATAVSCVPNMLDNGGRGILLSMELEKDLAVITAIIQNQEQYSEMVDLGVEWSRKYTLDFFESEIRKLLQP
jgi:glycosyltransferase involved in cell wall biosynthesis